ncbi:MAG: alpha/beta hydrolase [Gemmatimonadaceae bacterium]
MSTNWTPDASTPAFESATLSLARETDGELVATLLRHRNSLGARKAMIYVHGFIDYFFHDHVADAVLAVGCDFYALDLRRHGRSIREGNRRNCCTDLAQYFTEISAAIDIVMKEDGHDGVILYGHSTGGLVASLYGDHGERRKSLAGIVLNSPFFDLKIGAWQRMKLPIAVAIGGVFPFLSDPNGVSPMYGESIHKSKRGEWNYDLRWKPIKGFPAYFGWVRAIRAGQLRAQKGLAVQCPVLVIHSDATGGGDVWDESFTTCDIVLDVNDMRAYSAGLGANVTRTEIPGAVHDVMLSRLDVRTRALSAMTDWMYRTVGARSELPTATPVI